LNILDFDLTPKIIVNVDARELMFSLLLNNSVVINGGITLLSPDAKIDDQPEFIADKMVREKIRGVSVEFATEVEANGGKKTFIQQLERPNDVLSPTILNKLVAKKITVN
jgi:hypothetical protein